MKFPVRSALCLSVALFAGIISVNASPAHPADSRLAEKIGYLHAQQRLELTAALQAYTDEEYTYAYRLLIPLARGGDAVAQYYLATLYDMGDGIRQDRVMAFIWYKRAAVQGHNDAQHNLAVAYARGVNGKPDLQNAIHWWRRSASRGNIDSQFNLGVIYSGGYGTSDVDMAKALRWWRKAAINGDVAAQFNLGALYANGMSGQSSRVCEATRWWEKAADRGFKKAEEALSFIRMHDDFNSCP